MSTKAKPIAVSHERLLELFDYDPETGHFIRRVTTSSRAVAGAIAGSLNHAGYIRICVDGIDYLAHRLAYFYMTGEDVPAGLEIDHVNGVRADNRWQNIRLATASQNKCNAVRGGRSLPKGVTFEKATGRFAAAISIGGKPTFLGRFTTPEQAASAYAFAAGDLHGEFARLA